MAHAPVCADCGLVLPTLAYLSSYGDRWLCLVCYREAVNHPKQQAEVWLLERMFTRSAA